jgi:hypothetical protein
MGYLSLLRSQLDCMIAITFPSRRLKSDLESIQRFTLRLTLKKLLEIVLTRQRFGLATGIPRPC